MTRRNLARFIRPWTATSLAFFCIVTVEGTCSFERLSFNRCLPLSDIVFAAELQDCSVDGTWLIHLPMPGGTKESTLVLATHGDSISGTMSNPGEPADVHEIKNGTFQNGDFMLAADIGRITYYLGGTCGDDRLSFDLKTTEFIPLDDGRRLSGNTGEISGRYLVPVYSPGGIMENHFELAAENGTITGQMYVPVSGNDASPNSGPPPDMQTPPGGLPGDAPPVGGSEATNDGKRDVNTFQDGSYEGHRISLYTRTTQGSLFHFTGTVEGDVIKLGMDVTDSQKGLEALRIK